jgi:hypothetical protein
VGLGNDPDDYGLPPVDVEIPDDARELDRDVQAYRREQRQRRRERLVHALVRPLLRYGPIPPLVAGVLVIVATAATLMTVLAPQAVEPVRTQPTAAQSIAPVGRAGGRLPDGTLRVNGKPKSFGDISAAVVLTVPRRCRCGTTIGQIAWHARQVPVTVYLVSTGASAKELSDAARRAGQGVVAADDTGGVLARTYHPAGLAAILVHTDGIVGGERSRLSRRPGADLLGALGKLAYPGAGAPALGWS